MQFFEKKRLIGAAGEFLYYEKLLGLQTLRVGSSHCQLFFFARNRQLFVDPFLCLL